MSLSHHPSHQESPKKAWQPEETTNDFVSPLATLALSLFNQKLDAWERSGRQDQAYLLEGRALDTQVEIATIDMAEHAPSEHSFILESIVYEDDKAQRDAFTQNWQGQEQLLRPYFDRGMKAWIASKGKKRSALLYGSMLQRTADWACDQSLSKKEYSFLIDSLVEEQGSASMVLEEDKAETARLVKNRWPGLKLKTENPYAVLREILAWTECQPFLTQKTCQLLSLSNLNVLKGEESQKIRSLVELNFNKDSEDEEIRSHFNGVYSLLVRSNKENPFWLLFTYRKVLKKQRSGEDYDEVRSSIKFLEEVGLLIEKHGELQIRNSIYKSVFNEDWVEHCILSSCPYAEKLLKWLDSNCRDEDQLLSGEEVSSSMTWAKENDYRLTPLESKFLVYSIDS